MTKQSITDVLDKRRKREREPSRAVIANGSKGCIGCVLWFVGEDLEYEISDVSSRLDDLGLDDAPHGISIWEGRYVTRQVGNPYDGIEWESDAKGSFRAPTDDEWQAIREGRSPWPVAIASDGAA